VKAQNINLATPDLALACNPMENQYLGSKQQLTSKPL